MERDTEVALARQLMTGDAAAFDEFVEHFRRKIFGYSRLMCGNREDAEEVAQESLLNIFRNFDQLREPEHVRAWVFGIAKNACLMKRRKSLYAPEHELSLDELMPAKSRDGDGNVKIEIADWSSVPEDQAQQAEMKTLLERALAELPDTYRSVVLLRDMEELSTTDTAKILDLSEDVVKTRLHRARLALRQKLDQYLRGKEGTSDGTNP